MIQDSGIKAKLLSVCGLLSAVSVAVGLVGYFALKNVTEGYSWVANNSAPKIELSDQMFLNYRQVRVALRTLGLPGLSASDGDQAIHDVQEAVEQYEAANKAYIDLKFIPGQKDLYDRVDAAWKDFKLTGDKTVALYRTGKPEDRQKVVAIFFGECPAKAKVFTTAIKDLVEFHRQIGKTRTVAANSEASTARVIMISIIFAGIILSLAVALTFARSISAVLRRVVDLLSAGSSQVNAEVSQLSYSSGELASAATQQAAAIQETSVAIEEIRAMVEKNSQNASASSTSSELSKGQAEKGQKVVEEMIGSMSQIEDSNQTIMKEITESNRRISEIVQVIQEIGTKTQVINDIVFQTKLLSFNASVEAARAGEHGKGFAVVAEEVGNLANMSGNAAREISDMLKASVTKVEEIVRDTKGRVDTLMRDAKATVDRGAGIARQCGEVLAEIVTNARHVSDMVSEISHASQEQSSGVNEIAKAIQELDRATQTNASAAQLTASSSSTLSAQVDTLKSATEQLRSVVLGGGKSRMVSRFIWSDRYALGVNAMDKEHKILIEKINALATAIENSAGVSSRLIAPFEDLAAYTREHFSDEEAYLVSIGYPGFAGHQAIHKKLLAGVDDFGAQLRNGQFDGNKLVAFLNDWLIQHILGVDMKYAKFSKSSKEERALNQAA
ncbi:MAG: bacteriohemerythrin [Oligoflexia bacterium]|nr:bacteriohemerythrin [Oligoflexia bacterium]